MADKFQPPKKDLPDLADYEELTDIDWDDVRSLAEEQGWEWDEEQGGYVDDDGDPVSLSDVLDLTYDELAQFESQVLVAVDELEESEDVAEWERKIAEIAAAAAAIFFLLGIGGRNNVAPDHEEHVRIRLVLQFEFLREFSLGVLAGDMTLEGIRARANLYPQDDQLLYSEAQEFLHPAEDWPFYANRLGGCNHCRECPEETAKGIVERGELIPIGSRLCLWNCCCMFEYFKTRNGDTNAPKRLTDQCWGWAGANKLTLPVTQRITLS